MPQLDISTFPTQLIWLLISFVVLYAVLSRVAMPRIGTVIEERQRRIDGDLERATALKAEADAAMAAYEKAMTEARAGTRDIIRQAVDALTKQAEERQKELGVKLAAQIKAGEDRIGETKRSALAEIQTIAAGLARDMALKLADVSTDEAHASAAVKAAQTAANAAEAR
jgi:F-type H+-transporting ATPase subunit b